MTKETVKIPDLGGGEVDVIEVCVKVGDSVAKEDSLVVLESDKASMEIPSPQAGKVLSISIKEGSTVSEGDVILELEVEGDASTEEVDEPAPAPEAEQAAPEEAAPAKVEKTEAGGLKREMIEVPDVGASDGIEVIEVCVAEGDDISEGDSLVVLESDKASMEIPSPYSGKIVSLAIKTGDTAKQGMAIAEIEYQSASEEPAKVDAEPEPQKASAPAASPAPVQAQAAKPSAPAAPTVVSHAEVYAGPAVRKLAREFGLELEQVPGTGPRGRILKEDLQQFVKDLASGKSSAAVSGTGIPAIPEVDFSQFGEIDVQPLTKLHKLTAANMHRSWVNLPHVTQFDDVDISELEDFRASVKKQGEQRGVKLTPLPFLLKAAALALRTYPKFNASLSSDGESMIYKNYINIGIAVDTPAGLVVPVIRDVDKKSLWDLAAESAELAKKAKDRKLKPADMQGGCFTISSLGGIGGTGFTPIINAPEVAIMGVSKLAVKPLWNGSEFVPRKMLPVSLSYDHRAINGVDAGQFFTFLGELLTDIRKIML
ncbi:Dihydrolipoyllysine-residue acetyltransferase component of pyruvate dehydrogenase complex [Zhongshania aliphaticivorans]|uniref:Acetyltransferase component of pyruvate dehydrogenase complex n=1 Tax=Zhongshania aliphaticivorans TaxID=1470434 RepID=A0A5S9MW39_9GAMM|nr:dihydrolipoyllysine-residue acetyltransferase [Zhongshania aliphaticivorans]CAA0080918.1 Dihydrolipoyllysine-residue acetyltransferase component of pyruvate dehydrogenase complex [Zhongshania aliphaticivorans]CAA0085250.1 Dihydrolipoyllysine-residue acetyltransferase component of pyruvate dehydrogenase complex [Zhongshania aliphaticivorans]